MRLYHLGLPVSVVGDMTTPPLGPGDVFLVSSGPGETTTVLTLMQVARDAGATVLLLTAEAGGSAAELADFTLLIPAQTMARDQGPQKTSVLPMGSVFEGALFLLFEVMVLKLKGLTGRRPRPCAPATPTWSRRDALRIDAAAPDPQGDRGELAGRAAARRARISWRAHGRRHGHAGRHQDAGAVREGGRHRHPAAFLLRRGELCGGAAGGQRFGAGRRQSAGAVRARSCSTACCASAFATSTPSSTTRPRISPPACRPISPSRPPAGRRSSASSRSSAARAGGARTRWPTIIPDTPRAKISSTGCRCIR